MAVVQVNVSQLRTYLSGLPENTVDTPYQIEVTNLLTNPLNTLREALSSCGVRYVDLSPTTLPFSSEQYDAYFSNTSNLVIPPVITNTRRLQRTFRSCLNLKVAPVIPDGVSNMIGTFYGCESLEEPPVLPSSATVLKETFYGCSSLLYAPEIPSGAWLFGLENTFARCTSLKIPPVLPENIQSMIGTFMYCSSLEYKWILPSSVTDSQDCYLGVPTKEWRGTISQIESWLPNQTDEFDAVEVIGTTPTGRVIYGIDISNLSTWLSEMDANTADNPYEVKILGLTSSNLGDIKTALRANPTKYVDLRYTELPSDITDLRAEFSSCTSLIYAPNIPNGALYLQGCFENCSSLKQAPVIPNTVTKLSRTFRNCISLISAPDIPNSVTDLYWCFRGCSNITNPPLINCSIVEMDGTFAGCTSLISVPIIPNTVVNLSYCFEYCSSLRQAPIIPSGVKYMTSTFNGCTSLITPPTIPNTVTNLNSAFNLCANITEIAVIPSSVTKASNAFGGCGSLKKITSFQIPLATLKNNSDFSNMFAGCTALESIGYVINESDWHVWRLKYGSNTVEGKIFSRDGSYVSIPQTSITKSDLQLPILTDELWFPVEDDTATDTLIGKMLTNKYGVFKKETIPPDEKTMVLWADNPANFKSNVSMNMPVYTTLAQAEADLSNLHEGQLIAYEQGGDGVVDKVEKNDVRAVTSNAVAVAGSYSTTEHFTGRYWIDGKKIYESTFNITANVNNLTTTILSFQVDTPIKLEGLTLRNTGGAKVWYPLNQWEGSADYYTCIHYQRDSATVNKIDLWVHFADAVSSTATAYVDFFYTKTTD